ncbi:hypothetical protein BX286_2354 [Streptomyces sp. 3211.6]|uniref:hypothetical protein n=1 Tax=Streptomyces TaxID=1883 RepID=UPI000D19F76D|nr:MULTISPECIES: hypothetical protein [Streptomyces]RKT04403.1 hypothetical protein BX286_2354 [Streptomyces sp. 3211.6]
MGGWEHTRSGRHGRPARRRALLLLLALGVAAGMGFLCVRGGAAARGAAGPEGPVRVYVAHGAHGPSGERAACVSPYEPPGCSPLSHVTPAVLPAPPPALPAARPGPAPRALAAATGPVRPPGTLARAPDLYALQVLRT